MKSLSAALSLTLNRSNWPPLNWSEKCPDRRWHQL